MSALFNKDIKQLLDAEDRIAILDSVTGKILNIHPLTLTSQILNLELLGQSCIDYPETTVTQCSTGEETTLPLQLVQVLLKHEKILCELLSQQTSSNIPPIVDAGITQTIQLPTDTVTLNAFAEDVDGTIDSYLWEKVTGAGGTITTPNASQTTITGLTEDNYVFKVTVTDNDGNTATDIVVINVLATGSLTPPVADAGADQSINLPASTINLDGSGSTDADGTISSYQWIQISGASSTITNPNNSVTSVTGLSEEGTYVYQLTVTDNDGLTHTDTISVSVEAEALVPIAIEIDLGNCGSPADFVDTEQVYIKKTQTEINTGIIQINDGDIIYSDSGTTTPFNGGGNSYMYRGLPSNQVDDEAFVISATGVVSLHEVCPTSTVFSGVLEVDNCSDDSGQNTLADFPDGIFIGNQVYLEGTTTPFNGGDNLFRVTANGSNQFYNSTSGLTISSYIMQIDSLGIITSIVNCN